ncbi:MAG: hypothetical protein IJS03_03490 [Eubacterium sp.]|nr:hypothetical protein [Eubacterium sp.]
MKTKLSKRALSLLMSALMVVTMLPTFVIAPATASAQDTKDVSSAYWSILASTDFTKTNGKWSGTGDTVTLDNADTKTSAGGSAMGWTIKYADRHGVSGAEVDSNGVSIPWENSSHKTNGFLYMSKFNDQTTNTIFNGVDNFKIDLAFSYLGDSKACTGFDLNERRGGTPLIKLAKDSKYSFNSKYTDQANFFCQEAWGRRSVDDDYYKTDGTSGTADDSNGPYAISTYNSRSVISANTVYHYVVYYVDKMIGCYVTDDAGNVIINYNPIEMGSYNMAASVITSIYLGGSEFNWAGKYDLENVAYKSIEIYKGVDSHSYDSSRDKFLYAYFTGNDTAGETMHYAISTDGVNFEAVNLGNKVWDPANYPATDEYPSADSAPYTDAIQGISNHVRDTYAFIGNDGKDYVIATDLNTNGGNVYSNNSRFLMWKLDNFADIANTKPWSIDTSKFPGMDEVIGSTSSNQLQVKKAWAPQVIWDPDVGKYMLYWSVGAENNTKTQVYYTYTSDFKSDFTTVKRLMYPDFDGEGITNHIDADITYHNGLYYCYFKNEDSSGTGAKRIWYAVAPNANGPYTDFELVETGYGSEGPQVYEVSDGAYMLMVDGYGDSTYHMYSASTPYDFTNSNGTMVAESSTNVTSLSPRHGSIVRISDAEYQKLKKLRIGEELRYDWQTEGNYNHSSEQTDSTGNKYHVTWNPSSSTTTTGDGVLSITDSGMYSDLSTVQNFIASDVYSVTFNYKSNSSTTRDDTHSIFSISKSNAVENYVRLTSNGKFIVNNSQVAVSGNCSDGTTTRASKLSDAVNDTSNFHRFTVTSDGFSTSLIIDGEFICQTITKELDIPNTLWLTFGWARIPNYENNRLTAQFGQVIFKNVATETDKQDELYDTLKPENVNVATYNETKNQAYHESNAANNKDGSKAYSNVVYCSTSTGWPSSYTNKFYTNMKIAMPSNIVLSYDGVTTPSSPIVFEEICEEKNSNQIFYVSSNTSKLNLAHYWYGYTEKNQTISGQTGSGYQLWPGADNTSSSYDAWFHHTSDRGSDKYEFDNKNTNRFFWNQLNYTGSGNNVDYYETFTNPSFTAAGTYYSWLSWHDETTSISASGANMYVINYKPIYDILNGTTKIPQAKVEGATADVTISSLFSSDADNRWMYTKASYEQAMYAMKLLADCNPNNYNYSSDAAGQVAKCGQDIKKAIEAFNAINLKKNKFNITYRMADGTTKGEVVTAGDSPSETPDNTANYHIFDSNTHKKDCHWATVSHDSVPIGSAEYTEPDLTKIGILGFVPKANTVFTEIGTVEPCEKKTVAASGDTNEYERYECSVCGETNDDYRMWKVSLTADEWSTYDTHANAIATNAADTQYTTSSRSAYETDANAAIKGVSDGDPSKSESYINGKITALTTAERKLNHVADFSQLDAAVTPERTTSRNSNNYSGDTQLNTYSSWAAFATAYDNANGYHTKNAAQRADTPMYATDVSGYVTSDLSTDQTNINNYKNALTSATLVSINTDSLDTYETARSVITASLDTKKYTDDALSHVNGAINDANAEVYHTLTAAEATAYSTSTGGRTFVAGDKVRNVESADTQTTAIMTAVDEINDADDKDEYIKKYTVTFSVQDDDGEPLGTGLINDVEKSSDTIYYGDSFKLAVPDSLKNGRKITKWSTTYTEEDGATLSQKATGRLGSEITKIANSDMAVTAELTATSPQSGETYRYDICNAYGDVTNIIYSNTDVHGDKSDPTFTIDGVTIEAKKVPMYTCVGWTCSQVGENYYKFVPVLDNVPTYNFTVYGSVGSSSLVAVPYDEKVTLEYDTTFSTGTFAAWAVKTGSGKLQIASYSPNYYYYACANETYVPIVNTSNSDTPVYKYYNGSSWLNVTASSIEGSIANVEGADLDSVVTAKISNKVPFISIENVKMTETQARVYARFTEGSTVDGSSFGVLYRQNEGTDEQMRIGYTGTVRRNITSYVSSGQFTFTINNKSGAFSPSLTSVTFRAFVNYDLEYTADGDKAKINGLDYSVVSNAPRS